MPSSHAGSYTNLVVYSVSESWLAKVVLRTRSARPPCSVRLRRNGASVRSQSSSEITHEQAFATSPWRTLRRLSRSVFDLPLASRRVVCYAGTSDVTYGSWAPTQGFVTSIILMEAENIGGQGSVEDATSSKVRRTTFWAEWTGLLQIESGKATCILMRTASGFRSLTIS